jgi:hypothetical protein
MANPIDADDHEVLVASPPRPGRWDPLALGAFWCGVAGGLIAFAAVQAHPGGVERTLVALVLLAAIAISFAGATRVQLRRAARWMVPTVVILVVAGAWNPGNLAAVGLLLDHPVVAAIALGTLVVVLLVGAPTRTRRGATAVAVGAILLVAAMVALLMVSTFAVVYLGPGAFQPEGFRASDDAVRVDQHDGFEPGRCQVLVLRVGTGLSMRERSLGDVCYPKVAVAATADEIRVCVVGDRRTATRSRFDPTTLAPLGDAVPAVVDGAGGCAA